MTIMRKTCGKWRPVIESKPWFLGGLFQAFTKCIQFSPKLKDLLLFFGEIVG